MIHVLVYIIVTNISIRLFIKEPFVAITVFNDYSILFCLIKKKIISLSEKEMVVKKRGGNGVGYIEQHVIHELVNFIYSNQNGNFQQLRKLRDVAAFRLWR